MDHVRVHPRFLHSNATSHKWALGAFAELLDNALDETCNGATYVKVDVMTNKRDNTKMLLVEDNGGGMSPDKMRQCMSLGYSEKSKMANTIGQYGNGFKTSTMRLGADAIVFSRCRGKNGTSATQSIGLLSYTFLRSTGKEDIVVPIVDYEKHGNEWNRLIRASADDWDTNLETVLQWSPYESKEDLAEQFDFLKDQGTRIVIYNIWEEDQGALELDFDTVIDDIQIRGVNRNPKKIEMAKKYPNSRHYLTYQHSLRSYASIMYLRLPPGFRIILRGKDVDHHNLVNDMMMVQTHKYKPVAVAKGARNDSNMTAIVTIGFVKDAGDHIDIQGFNVYHKNRLIKPFWRLWNAAGSDGRGVIGVLEADFVEPAHDKQGFERTTVLSRLEQRLISMQKEYWNDNCQDIGYAARRKATKSNTPSSDNDKTRAQCSTQKGHMSSNGPSLNKSDTRNLNQSTPLKNQVNTKMTPEHRDDGSVRGSCNTCHKCGAALQAQSSSQTDENARCSSSKGKEASNLTLSNSDMDSLMKLRESDMDSLIKLRQENRQLKLKLQVKSEPTFGNLVAELQYQKDKCASLQNEKDKCASELEKTRKNLETFVKDQAALIDIFQEDMQLRDDKAQELKKKYEDETNALKKQLETLGKDNTKCCKVEPL